MRNSKLFSLLKTFSKKELKDFEKFIYSPYFSKGRNLEPLFNYLKKHYPDFDSPRLSEEKIFKKCYPDKKYDKVKSKKILSVILSELTSLAEKFLAFEYLQHENDGYRVHNALSMSLEKRNMNKYRLKLISDNIDRINKYESGNTFFYEMTILHTDMEAVLVEGFKKLNEADKYIQRMPLYIYGLLLYFFTKLINDYKSMYIFNLAPKSYKLLEMGINGFDPEIFVKECYDDGLGTKELVLMLYNISRSLLNPDDKEYFTAAIEIYKNNFNKFKWCDKWWYFVVLTNISSFRINLNVKYYSAHGSSLIDFVIEQNVTGPEENHPLSTSAFLLIIPFKIRVCSHIELKKFIDATIEKVEKHEQKWLKDYAYAWYHFKKKEYEKTLELLSKFNPKFLPTKTQINKLKILSLYSLNYFEEALYSLNSEKQYTKSIINKSGNTNIQSLQFSNSIRTLIMCKINSNDINNHDLDKIIEYSSKSMFGFWFKEEAEKIKKAGLKPA